jgi:hypothetical protein
LDPIKKNLEHLAREFDELARMEEQARKDTR